MASVRVNISTITMALAVLGLVAWLIALAGVGATHAKCNEITAAASESRSEYDSYFSSYGYSRRQSSSGALGMSCTALLQQPWWSVWFNFFLLLAIMILGCRAKLVAHKITIIALLVACLGVTMGSATDFTTSMWRSPVTQSQEQASAAGFVMLSMVHFALIIILGSFMGNDAGPTGNMRSSLDYATASDMTYKQHAAAAAATLPAAGPLASGIKAVPSSAYVPPEQYTEP